MTDNEEKNVNSILNWEIKIDLSIFKKEKKIKKNSKLDESEILNETKEEKEYRYLETIFWKEIIKFGNKEKIKDIKNYFSIIIGKNGVWKSSFIEYLIEHFIIKNTLYDTILMYLTFSVFDRVKWEKKNVKSYIYNWVKWWNNAANINNIYKNYKWQILKNIIFNDNFKETLEYVYDSKDKNEITFNMFIDENILSYYNKSKTEKDFINIVKTELLKELYRKWSTIKEKHIESLYQFINKFYDIKTKKNQNSITLEKIKNIFSNETEIDKFIDDLVNIDKFRDEWYINKYSKFEIVVNKKNIEYSSTWELVLLYTLSNLISLNNNNKNIIIIDEPEISLHPQWQRDYFERLNYWLEKLGLTNCFFIIVTHSPLIVLWSQDKELDNENELKNKYNVDVYWFKKGTDWKTISEPIKYISMNSIDDVLWDDFWVSVYSENYKKSIKDRYNSLKTYLKNYENNK